MSTLADNGVTPAKWTNIYKFSAYKSGGNQATTAGVATINALVQLAGMVAD